MNGTMARHNAMLNTGLSALTWESSLKGSITHYLHEVISNADQLALKCCQASEKNAAQLA